VLILSDHVLFRQALSCILREDGFQVTDQPCHAPLRTKRPEAAVIDLSHTTVDTTKLMASLSEGLAGSHLVVIGSATRLAGSLEGSGHSALEIPHADLSSLRNAIQGRPPPRSTELSRAHRLWSQVTNRQRQVMRWLAFGHDNSAIALKLRVGTRAIKAHISALLALFGLDSRAQLALVACEGGLRP